MLAEEHWDQNEEFITDFFRGNFRSAIKSLAETKRIAKAFLTDLRRFFPQFKSSDKLELLANDVTATTTFHPREVERKTGGDLGIVLLRPSVESVLLQKSLKIHQDYPRGLLCQAKINRRSSKPNNVQWGALTPNQKKVLPSRTDYLALLLYKYGDEVRHCLEPFQWQLCRGVAIAEVDDWLRRNSFPEIIHSSDVIHGLGNCTIGTDNRRIIENYIAPKVRDALIIRIGWPPDGPPPDSLLMAESYRPQRRKLLVMRR